MRSSRIVGIWLFAIIFLILTILNISNLINISDDAQYLGILIYIGVMAIILAMPDKKDIIHCWYYY